MEHWPDLSIITVNHNHGRFLQPFLRSIFDRPIRLDLELWLVDNCSTDGSTEWVRSAYPQVQVIVNTTRRGFAGNNNMALAASRGRYALLLNPDTEVQPGALETLVRFMDEHPQAGACGAQLRFPDGTLQLSCRRFPSLTSFLVRRTPFRRFLWGSLANARHLMADIDHDSAQPVDWLLGACLMVRREVIDTVGLLDEGYFLYVEDIDWCYRMWQRGWQVWYVPSAVIIHHHLAVSDKEFFSHHSWIHFQSMVRFFRKFWAPPIPFLRIQTD